MGSSERFIRTCTIITIVIIFFYLVPAFYNTTGLNLDSFLQNDDGLSEAWLRSLLITVISTFFNLLASLFIALQLKNIKINSYKGRFAVFLLIPVLLGNVSVAFIGRMLFTNISIIQSHAASKLIVLLIIQFWQYGTLYVYLFWLIIQSLPESTVNYAVAARLNAGEYAKDILLPSCRNLAILLFIVNFTFAFYEDAKTQIIFKSSRGTDTELISQWLSRNYLSNSLINQQFSIHQTENISSTVIISAILLLFLTVICFSYCYNKFISSNSLFKYYFENNTSKVTWYFLLLFVTAPLVLVLFTAFKPLQFDISTLFFPLFLTLLAAISATAIAIILSTFLRLGWKRILHKFDNRSITFFTLFFVVELIPPLLLLISGYQWLRLADVNNNLYIYTIWIAGHVILSLPLISSFLAVTHFRTLNSEINFFNAHHLRLAEILKTGFLMRYKIDYILTFLIAFSLIWNESIINNIMSDYIPSFVSQLKMTIEGRAVDFSKGISYLLVSLIIAFLAIISWLSVLKKIERSNAIGSF